MKHLIAIVVLCSCFFCNQGDLAAQLTNKQQQELATMDAVFTMMGSLDSYINNHPDEAIRAIQSQKQIFDFANNKKALYAGAENVANRFDERIGDRMRQLESGEKNWQNAIERFKKNSTSRLDSPLRMLEREIQKIRNPKKTRKPRKPSFSMITSVGRNSMKQARVTIDILKAIGAATPEQVTRYEKVKSDFEALEDEFEADMAQHVRFPRDAYRSEDRAAIEQCVRNYWKKLAPEQVVEKIVIPSTNWNNLYGARWDKSQSKFEISNVERLFGFALVQKSNELTAMHPVVLERQKASNTIEVLPSKERPQSILSSKIK